MFDIGMQEILVILAIALIFIGPKRLPEVASTLGKGFGEFKKALDNLKESATMDIKTELEKTELLRKHPHLAEQEEAAAAQRVPAGSQPAGEESAETPEETPGETPGEAPTPEEGAAEAGAGESEIPIHEPEKSDA